MGIIQGSSMVYNFTSKDKIYIKKGGIYYLVNNKNDVLNLFNKNRAAINSLVKKQNLNWRKEFDQCVTIAAQYYDNPSH